MKLKGKVAVVTGGSRGIGRAIALKLAEEGASICVNYRGNAEATAETIKQVKAAGGDAFSIQADVGSVTEIGQFFEQLDAELETRHGDRRFDILVNNAGVACRGNTATLTEEAFDQVFRVNAKGPFFAAQQAIPRLKDGGRIINISSGLSLRPMPETVAYSMTKAALNIMTVALAAELGSRQITVNTLAPGLTATELNAEVRAIPGIEAFFKSMTALGRIGAVEEIANAVSLLAAPEASWVTGQYLEASGGLGLALPMPRPN